MSGSGKKLSTGTLSLKFMQNAQRSKQLKEVELDKAPVEDDGQWEIAKEIRESWGPPAESDNSITYEQSYLPFLFPSLPASASAKPKGRRVFKRGKEVQIATASSTSEATPPSLPLDHSENSLSSSSRRTPKANIDISRSTSRPITKSSMVAKLAIFDNSQVGTDLGPPTGSAGSQMASSETINLAPPSNNVFLKPAGVDEPKAHNANSDSTVITGARQMKTTKRERKSYPTQTDTDIGVDGPKRKKKKSKISD